MDLLRPTVFSAKNYLQSSHYLGQNKKEQRLPPPPPPPPQIKDEAAQKPKRAIFRQLSVKMWANLSNSFREIHYDRNYVCVNWLEAATFLSHAHQTEASFFTLLSRDFEQFFGQIVFIRVKKLNNINFVASKAYQNSKRLTILVDMRRSKKVPCKTQTYSNSGRSESLWNWGGRGCVRGQPDDIHAREAIFSFSFKL